MNLNQNTQRVKKVAAKNYIGQDEKDVKSNWTAKTCCCSLKIKTHGHVSAAKKDVWHTSVLFTGTPNSPFSTPHMIQITHNLNGTCA